MLLRILLVTPLEQFHSTTNWSNIEFALWSKPRSLGFNALVKKPVSFIINNENFFMMENVAMSLNPRVIVFVSNFLIELGIDSNLEVIYSCALSLLVLRVCAFKRVWRRSFQKRLILIDSNRSWDTWKRCFPRQHAWSHLFAWKMARSLVVQDFIDRLFVTKQIISQWKKRYIGKLNDKSKRTIIFDYNLDRTTLKAFSFASRQFSDDYKIQYFQFMFCILERSNTSYIVHIREMFEVCFHNWKIILILIQAPSIDALYSYL